MINSLAFKARPNGERNARALAIKMQINMHAIRLRHLRGLQWRNKRTDYLPLQPFRRSILDPLIEGRSRFLRIVKVTRYTFIRNAGISH